ncbi:MAG TPA: hypothetical protein EYQ50_14635 [Verrucomicrobiales bacterium]|nr:hypothetical protein [Verrucomicrobiales bacterium]
MWSPKLFRVFLITCIWLSAGLVYSQTDADAPRIPPTTELGGPAIWPPYEKIEAVLKHWAKNNPDRYTLEEQGLSVDGRSIYSVTMTDPTVPDNTKEHALVTALHAGIERGASTTVMSIIEWFLSDDPRAADILHNQIVVFLPLVDPDRYEKGHFTPIYTEWNTEGPLKPDEIPEAVYVQKVFDEFQPDIHADIHGTSLDFKKYIMFESSGAAYSNNAVRPYHREIIRQMNVAALDAGYPMDTGESDAERQFYGPGVSQMARKSWYGQPRYYGSTYLYDHFHTLISATEVAWEQSGLIRHQRLLEIGNERWPGYYYTGYPNRVIMGNTHATLVAYGQDAESRRRSRLELWNRMDEFTFGTLDPAMEGRASAFLSTSARAHQDYLSGLMMDEALERLKKYPGLNYESIEAFFRDWPAGQNGPTPQLYLTRRATQAPPVTGDPIDVKSNPIKHGASIKLRLPYQRATIESLELNGRPIPRSETSGYVTWVARGCTYIQVNLSPEQLAKDDLFIVTCAYDPGETRGHWDTWRRIVLSQKKMTPGSSR